MKINIEFDKTRFKALTILILIILINTSSLAGILNKQITENDIGKVIVYYLPLELLTEPVSINQIKTIYFYKVEIKGDTISNLKPFLNRINNLSLEKEARERSDFKIYYEIYNPQQKLILNVGLEGYGGDGFMYLNGITYRQKTIFYEFIKPFIPVKEKKSFNKFLKIGKL